MLYAWQREQSRGNKVNSKMCGPSELCAQGSEPSPSTISYAIVFIHAVALALLILDLQTAYWCVSLLKHYIRGHLTRWVTVDYVNGVMHHCVKYSAVLGTDLE